MIIDNPFLFLRVIVQAISKKLRGEDRADDSIAFTLKEKIDSGEYRVVPGVFGKTLDREAKPDGREASQGSRTQNDSSKAK